MPVQTLLPKETYSGFLKPGKITKCFESPLLNTLFMGTNAVSKEDKILEALERIEEKLDRLLNPQVWGDKCPTCKQKTFLFNGQFICLICGK